MTTQLESGRAGRLGQGGYALGPGEGEAYWFLGTLGVVKAGGEQTRGAYTLIEDLLPPGFAPPLHVHQHEDEGFYVLSGQVTIWHGEEQWEAGPGTFAFLPRDVPHTFQVGPDEPARMLQLTSQAQFEKFMAEVGEETELLELPPPSGPPDLGQLDAIAARYGITLLGPPPNAV